MGDAEGGAKARHVTKGPLVTRPVSQKPRRCNGEVRNRGTAREVTDSALQH